jgi:hypothetical protein
MDFGTFVMSTLAQVHRWTSKQRLLAESDEENISRFSLLALEDDEVDMTPPDVRLQTGDQSISLLLIELDYLPFSKMTI